MDDDVMIILGCLLLVLGLIIGAITFSSYECHSKAEKQGYECSWGPVQGCMIKVDGKWIDYKKWRVMK